MGMSHARKDTLVAAKTPHRGPHLTKEAKRRTAKAERQAAKALVNKVEEQKPEGLGLHNEDGYTSRATGMAARLVVQALRDEQEAKG